MKIHFLTIVLDGMPWITMHYPIFRQLPFDWEWHVVEGVASNEHCTQWCNSIPPRLSKDGTTEYLDSLKFDSRVRLYRKHLWNGKLSMVNTPLAGITEPSLLWQVDSDELWRVEQIERMRRMFAQEPDKNEARFYCRYFVGPDIITTDLSCYGNNSEYEWVRVWRFQPGTKFRSHEPPNLIADPKPFLHAETYAAGLVFDHYAYATEATVAFKQEYYGRKSGLYKNAVADWKRLQANTKWPVKLRDFLPWVDDKAQVQRI